MRSFTVACVLALATAAPAWHNTDEKTACYDATTKMTCAFPSGVVVLRPPAGYWQLFASGRAEYYDTASSHLPSREGETNYKLGNVQRTLTQKNDSDFVPVRPRPVVRLPKPDY
jgi:hypothetical protein